MALYIALLFFVLAPGILLTIPRGGSKTMVAMTHALVAAAVFYFTHKMAYNFLRRFEAFQKMGVDASAKKVKIGDSATKVVKTTMNDYAMGG